MSGKPQTAVVTGAASGIGEAVARRLLSEGMAVVAVDLDADRLAGLERLGARACVADLSHPDDRARVAKAADGIDYLVNAAGIIRVKPVTDVTLDDWRDIFAVNAEAVFFLCQAIGPRMRPGGAIVNLSSSSAKLAWTLEAAVYAASKAAVLSITRSFAYALAPLPVRVNAICPGIVDTGMQDRLLEDVARLRGTTVETLSEARTNSIPLARASSADECAAAIRFLLSDDAAYMTGQAIDFSGGLVMW